MKITDTKPFLWVEKWAPESVEDLILTKSVKEFFTNVVNEGQLNQNLILQGSQGCGKTQTWFSISNFHNLDPFRFFQFRTWDNFPPLFPIKHVQVVRVFIKKKVTFFIRHIHSGFLLGRRR